MSDTSAAAYDDWVRDALGVDPAAFANADGGNGSGGSGDGGPPVGANGGGGDDGRLFPNLNDQEIDTALDQASSAFMLEVRGQTRDIGLRLGRGQPDYWGAEPDTGMTVQEWNVQAARGLPRLDAAGNPLPPPHGDVATRVRLHSADPTAPANSPSAQDWTMGIDQGNRRMLPDGSWFDTRCEISASGQRIDVRPYSRAADGTVVETATNTPVTDPEVIAAWEASEAKMAASHIPLFPERPSGAGPGDPAGGPGGGNANGGSPASDSGSTSAAPGEGEGGPTSATPSEGAGAEAAEAGMGDAAGAGALGGAIAGGMALYDDIDKVRSGQMSVADAAADAGGKAAEVGSLTFAGKMAANALGGGGAEAAAAAGGGDAIAGAAGAEAGAGLASVAAEGGVIGGVVAGGMALIDDVGKVESGQMTGGHAAVDVTAKTAVGVGAGLAGAAAGAEIGAAIGTAIPVPLVGTAVGLVAGAVVGGAVGYIGNALTNTETGKAILNAAGDAVDAAVDGVEEAGKAVEDAAGAAAGAVENAAGAAASAVGGALGDAADAIGSLF